MFSNDFGVTAKPEKSVKYTKLFKDIVLRIAQESHCLSWKVAAIAVKNGRIVGQGINGSRAGSINCDDYFEQYHKSHNIIIPFFHWIRTPEWRELHHEWSKFNEFHAEMNLICECARNGICLEGCDIYVSVQPCAECTKTLALVNPKNIFYVQAYDKTPPESVQFIKDLKINYQQI